MPRAERIDAGREILVSEQMNRKATRTRKSTRRRNRGFIQIRRGLEEHLVSGAIGAFEVGVYLMIQLQANFCTGLWVGSAARLLATAPRGASLRDMQRALQRLAKIGFIRVFHRHGQRGNYRVLIHKYEPQIGALKGQRLNAIKSESWERPLYEPCAVVDAETDAQTDAEAAPILKEEVKEEQKETSACKNSSQKSEVTADAGLRFTSHTNSLLKRGSQKINRQKLNERIAAQLKGETLADFLDYYERETGKRYHEWWPEVKAACRAARYKLRETSPVVGIDFVDTLKRVYEKQCDKNLLPGIFATKVIDSCEKNKILYPPDFEEHRNRLRRQERAAERAIGKSMVHAKEAQ